MSVYAWLQSMCVQPGVWQRFQYGCGYHTAVSCYVLSLIHSWYRIAFYHVEGKMVWPTVFAQSDAVATITQFCAVFVWEWRLLNSVHSTSNLLPLQQIQSSRNQRRGWRGVGREWTCSRRLLIHYAMFSTTLKLYSLCLVLICSCAHMLLVFKSSVWSSENGIHIFIYKF